MKVKEFMPKASKRLATVAPEMEIHEAAKQLAEPGTDLVVVTGADGKMVGVLTDTDIVTWVAKNEPGEPGKVTVGTLMSTEIFSCTVDQLFGGVIDQALKRRRKHFPVLDDEGAPIGVVYIADALIALHKEDQLSPEAVTAFIYGRGWLG